MSFLKSIGKAALGPFGMSAGLFKKGSQALGLGGQTRDQTTTQAPWLPQQEYLRDIFQEGQGLFNQGGPLTPELSSFTRQGMGMLANNPQLDAPGDFISSTLQGDFLNSNPYLDETYDRAFGQANRSLLSNFAGGNRFGSGAHQGATADLAGNLASDIYGGNFQNERQRQMQAAGMAPGLLNMRAQNALQAGSIQDQFAQQRALDPYDRLARYQGAVSGNYGGTSTTPMYRNPIAGLLGGAGTGAKIGAAAGHPLIGAGIGGLLGLVG